jgi:N-acetylglucosaminyldiphosphoundecaprenol N-acetyl-beta-D-mannosaminyltransferase
MKLAVGDWKRGEFLGVPLDGLTTEQFVDLVAGRLAKSRAPGERPLVAAYLNASTSNQCAGDAEHAAFLRDVADVVYADGMGVVWGARALRLECPERVNAGDFLPRLLRSLKRPARLAMLGGWEGLAEAAGKKLIAEAPAGSVLWTGHGYLDDERSRREAIGTLKAFAPDLLLLGMGAPRQERFAKELLEAGSDAAVVWCVGALFEYFAGRRARAPIWMRKAGLEWVARLALEPRRMWKRYLVGNVLFAARTLRRKFAPRG